MAIIKCPECGHDVSDKAPHCPSCGIQISNNIVICPDCGTTYLYTQGECPKCHRVTPQSKHQADQPQKEDLKKKSYKKRTAIILTIVVVLTALMCLTLKYIHDNQQRDKHEREEYEYALSSNDAAILQNYIDTFTESGAPQEHIQMIESRLAELHKADLAWRNAVASGTKNALEQYLNDYPNAPQKRIAIHKVDSMDWVSALYLNTIDAYETYQREHPNGEYFDQATQNIKEINLKTVLPEEEIMIDMVFRNFFQSINNKDEEALLNTVNTIMTSFLGKQSATNIDAMTFMNKIYKSDVARMHWHTNGNYDISKKEIGNEQYEYTVVFDATQDIEYIDATIKRQNYKITSKVAQDNKIQDFNMKRLLE